MRETSSVYRKLHRQKLQGGKNHSTAYNVWLTGDFWELQWRSNTAVIAKHQKCCRKKNSTKRISCCFKKSSHVSNCLVSSSSSGFVCEDFARRSPAPPLERLDHVGKLKLYEMMTNIMNSGNRFYRGYYSSENLHQDTFLYIYCTWWTKCLWFWL